MKLFWGDIHNHCGITYGFGGLENALKRAKEHLDFCAVTGHAMWPDMPEKNSDTEFLISFHNTGFNKLKNNWEKIRNTINRFNSDKDFVTFLSYEMHGSTLGDYHLVSPDSDIDLIYATSPKELIEKLKGHNAIMIPHHIAYKAGYRGIDWNHFDSSISPVVEVHSKHGCSMNDKAPYPYYHNMGARDSHNTVYEGLKKGHRFSFVASTDHHAGYPGSYGDGKLAVLCKEKTRSDIFNAIRSGQTYAVTGDRIKCDFTINGAPFGSSIRSGASKREIMLWVNASHFIDKIVLYKNLRPMKIINGETLNKVNSKGRYKIRIEMGWGNNKDLFTWNGSANAKNGTIVDVEKCFRGQSILAPAKDISADDDVNLIDNRILHQSENRIEWVCQTVKNTSTLHPSTSAIVLEIDGDLNTVLSGSINEESFTFTVSQLLEHGFVRGMKPYNSQSFKIHQAVPESVYDINLKWVDETKEQDCDFYHVEVYQTNGSCAFISPIYVG